MSQKLAFVMLAAVLLVQTGPQQVLAETTIAAATVAPPPHSPPPEALSTAASTTASSEDSSKTATDSISFDDEQVDTLSTFDRESLRLDNYTVVQGKNILKDVLQQTGAVRSAPLQARLDEIDAFVAHVERYLRGPVQNVALALFDLMKEFIEIGDNFDKTARSQPDDAEIVRFKNLMAEQLDQLVDAIIEGGLKEFGAAAA